MCTCLLLFIPFSSSFTNEVIPKNQFLCRHFLIFLYGMVLDPTHPKKLHKIKADFCNHDLYFTVARDTDFQSQEFYLPEFLCSDSEIWIVSSLMKYWMMNRRL